jgi:hypothetical protein
MPSGVARCFVAMAFNNDDTDELFDGPITDVLELLYVGNLSSPNQLASRFSMSWSGGPCSRSM